MQTPAIHRLSPDDPVFPQPVQLQVRTQAPQGVTAAGNLDLLKVHTLAIFCSQKCPGSIILQTYDLMQQLRDGETAIISGFHSPMEKECLAILLRGSCPIIVCPARGMPKRMRQAWKSGIEQGRMLIISPFSDKQQRITSELAQQRNRFVSRIAETIFVPYAASNSKTEQFCAEVISWGKPILTLNDEANANLIALGAKTWDPAVCSESLLLRQQ